MSRQIFRVAGVLILLGVVSLASAAQQPRITLCEGGAACDEADIRIQGDPVAGVTPELGFSAVMGYLNNDLFSDLVIGAPGVGKVYIIYGSLNSPVTASPPVLGNLDAMADLVLCDGSCTADPPNTSSQFGFSVAIGPRANGGDTVGPPVLIGAPAVGDPNNRGAAYVIENSFIAAQAAPSQVDVRDAIQNMTAGVLEIVRTTAISTADPADQIGYAVAVGPLLQPSTCPNNDSCTSDLECTGACNHVDNYAVSARMSAAGGSNRGIVYVIPMSAATGNTIDLDTGAGITQIMSTSDDEGLGEFLVAANLDRDPLPDPPDPYELAIGAVGTDPDDTTNIPGRVYYVPVAGVASPIMLVVNPPSHVTFEGDRANDFFGYSIVAGDFDNQGDDDDLAIGAIYADRAGQCAGGGTICRADADCPGVTCYRAKKNAGALYLFADPGSLAPGTYQAMSAATTFWGDDSWDQLGFSLASADFDDDGDADLASGAIWHDRFGTGFCSNTLSSANFGRCAYDLNVMCSTAVDAACPAVGGNACILGVCENDFNTRCQQTSDCAGVGGGDCFPSPLTCSGDADCSPDDDCIGQANVPNAVDEGAVYVLSGPLIPFAAAPPASAICEEGVCLDCPTDLCDLPPPGVASMLLGGDFSGESDQIGFSLAAGDFNQNSGPAHCSTTTTTTCTVDGDCPGGEYCITPRYGDLAVGSRANDRVYLVSTESSDPMRVCSISMTICSTDANCPMGETCMLQTVPSGQVTDNLRDIRDADDDGDGYPDNQEDANQNGRLDKGGAMGDESDPLVPNRDIGVAISGIPAAVDCDNDFAVTIQVTNASRNLSIDGNEINLRVPFDTNVYEYRCGSTMVTNGTAPADGANCVADPNAAFPFINFTNIRTAPLPATGVITVTFNLRVNPNPATDPKPVSSAVMAEMQNVVTNELSDPHPDPMITVAPNQAASTVNLQCPDMSFVAMSTTAAPDPVTAGTPLTYNITAQNSGTAAANGVVVAHTLDANVAIQAAQASGAGCVGAGGTWDETAPAPGTPTVPTCTFTTIAQSAMATYSVPVDVAPSTPPGNLSTALSVATTNRELDSTNNAATVMTVVNTAADLDVTGSTDAPDPVVAGGVLTYTVSASNATGPSDAQTVVVTHTLDAAVAVQAAQASGAGCMGAGGMWDETTPTAPTCTFTTIAQGATPIYAVPVDVSGGAIGPLSTTVSVASATTDPNAANDSIALATAVTTQSDLTVAKTGPPSVVAGAANALVYSITVNNLGPSVVPGSQTVTVTDTLPLGTGGWMAVGNQWNCGLSGGTPEVVTCTRQGALGLGLSDVITVTGTVDASGTGTLSNNATVTTLNDLNAGNDTSTPDVMTTVNASADLDVTTSSDGPDPVVAGAVLTYNVVADNTAGPSDAQMVVVTHTLDGSVAVQGAMASGVGCTGAGGTWDETAPAAPTCTFTTIAMGAMETYAVPVDVSGAATGMLTTTVSVASATTDGNGANDSVMLATTVNASADLDVTTSSDSPDPVVAGAVLTYNVVADNTAGPSDAQMVVVTHTLDGSVAVQGAMASGAGCTGAGGTWDETAPAAPTCTFTTIAMGAMETYAVPVDVSGAATGMLTTTVSVASATTDGNGANDSVMLATTVNASADLDITGSSVGGAVTAGNPLDYMIVVSNAGPSDAQSVVVTHALDTDVAVQAAQASGSGCVGAGGVWDETTATAPTCTFATIAMGAMETYTMTVDVSGGATSPPDLSTTVSVAAATADPNNVNDSEPLTTTVSFVPPVDVVISVDPDALGWTPVPGAGTYNLYRGNLSALKAAGIYTQDPGAEPAADRMCNLAANSESEAYAPPLGEVVFYLVSSDNGLVEGTLGWNSAGVERTNDNPCP